MGQNGFNVENNNEYTPNTTTSLSQNSQSFDLKPSLDSSINFNDLINIEEYNFDDEYDIPDEVKLYSLIKNLESKIALLEEEYQECSMQLKKNPTDAAAKLSMISNQKKELEKKLSTLKAYETQQSIDEMNLLILQTFQNSLNSLEKERDELLTEMKYKPSQEITDRLAELSEKIEYYNSQISSINNAINLKRQYEKELNELINSMYLDIDSLDADKINKIDDITNRISELNNLIQVMYSNQNIITEYQQLIITLEAQYNNKIAHNRTELTEKNDVITEINNYKKIISQLKLNGELTSEILNEVSSGKNYLEALEQIFEKYIIDVSDKASNCYMLLISELMVQIQNDPNNEELINKYNKITDPQLVYQQYLEQIFAEQNPSIPNFNNNPFGIKYENKKITRLKNIGLMLGFDVEELYQKQMEYLESQEPQWWEQLLAGQAEVVMAVGQGVAKGGEYLLDLATLITGGLAMIGTSIFDLFAGQFGNPNSATYAVKNATEEAIEIDRVKNCEDSLIKYDKVFQWIENKSPDLLKQDGMVKNIVEGLSEIAFQIVLGNEISAITNVAKGSGVVLSAGLRGFSHGTEKALKDGVDLTKAIEYGSLSASWEMAQWTIAQKLEFIKTLASTTGTPKFTQYMYYMSYILLNGEDAAIESFVQPLLQKSYSDKEYWDLYNENGGDTGLGIQFGFGIILSTLSLGLDLRKTNTTKVDKANIFSNEYAETRKMDGLDLQNEKIECEFIMDRNYLKLRKFFLDQRIDGLTDSVLEAKLTTLKKSLMDGVIDTDKGYAIIKEYLDNYPNLSGNSCYRNVLNALDECFKNGDKEYAFKTIQLICENIDLITFGETFELEHVTGLGIYLNPNKQFNNTTLHELGHLIDHLNTFAKGQPAYNYPSNLNQILTDAQNAGKENAETLLKFYKLIKQSSDKEYIKASREFIDNIINSYGSIENYQKNIIDNINNIKDMFGEQGLKTFIRNEIKGEQAYIDSLVNNIMSGVDISTESGIKFIAEQIYNLRISNYAMENACFKTIGANFEDLIASIYGTKNIPIDMIPQEFKSFGHSEDYYNEGIHKQFCEIIANVNNIKLSGRSDLMEMLRSIFGDELFDAADAALEITFDGSF